MSSPVSDKTPRIFHEESSEIAELPSTSPLAVISLILGLASIGAMLTPILWAVPVVAVLVGFQALRSIAANPLVWRGRGLVIVALALACFWGGMAPVYHITRHHTLNTQARVHAEHWIDLIRQGKLMEAHQLRLGFNERVEHDLDLKEHYKSELNRLNYDVFATGSPIKELAKWGPQAEIRSVDNILIESTGTTDIIKQRFHVVNESDGIHRVLVMDIAMLRRTFAGSSECRWEVHNCQVVSLPVTLP